MLKVNFESTNPKLSALVANELEDLSIMSAALDDEVIQDLIKQEAKATQRQSKLSRRFSFKHPKVNRAESEIALAEESIRNQIAKRLKETQEKLEKLKAEETMLFQQKQSLETRASDIHRIERGLEKRMREVAIRREVFETFLRFTKDAPRANALASTRTQILEPATVPSTPVKPQKLLLAFTASPLA